jgi:hypothetical protein
LDYPAELTTREARMSTAIAVLHAIAGGSALALHFCLLALARGDALKIFVAPFILFCFGQRRSL